MMILITGAAGKTGRAVIHSLTRDNLEVRAFVKNKTQAEILINSGTREIFIGDLRNLDSVLQATQEIDSIYLICPNVSPDELNISKIVLAAARKNHVKRVIYHSVLHPQVEAMPHHWLKMRVEEAILEAGIEFTILQPCAYMQNILSGWEAIQKNGIFSVPYSTSSRLSLVDLADVADVAARVITQPGHQNAIYELAGPEPISQDEVADILSKILPQKVRAESLPRSTWEEQACAGGMDDYARDTLIKMFEYYEKYGLIGNAGVLETLLGRPSTRLIDFIQRQIVTNAGISA